MIANYEYKMAGPYSDLASRAVVILVESCVDMGPDTLAMDAPIYVELDQEDFQADAEQYTHETIQFC